MIAANNVSGGSVRRPATTEAKPATTQAGERKRRSPQVVEVRVVVDLQLPAWLQTMQPNGSAFASQMQAVAIQAAATATTAAAVIQHGGLTPSRSPEKNADPSRGEKEDRAVPNQDVGGSAFLVTSSTVETPVFVSGTSQVEASPVETGLSFESAFLTHVLPLIQLETKPSVHAEYRTSVKHFVEWYKTHHRSVGPMVADLCQQPQLLSDFYSYSLGKGSEGTASNKLKCLKRIWKDLFDLELITRAVPKPRTKQIRKKEGVEKSDHIPMPVTDSEWTRCLSAILDLHDDLVYPRFRKIEPFQFWFNVFATCGVHGIRPADFWPLEAKSGIGLEWSEVSLSESPPIVDGEKLRADWEFGWLNLRMNKTGRRLRTPMSPHLRFLVQQFHGLDPCRVFPLSYDRQRWYQMLSMIFRHAGFSQVQFTPNSPKRHWPLSLCGGSPQSSLRKTASVLWRRHGTPRLASFMLGHSSRTGSAADVDEGSEVTEEHYSGSETFAEVVTAFPRVLAALPSLIRC